MKQLLRVITVKFSYKVKIKKLQHMPHYSQLKNPHNEPLILANVTQCNYTLVLNSLEQNYGTDGGFTNEQF